MSWESISKVNKLKRDYQDGLKQLEKDIKEELTNLERDQLHIRDHAKLITHFESMTPHDEATQSYKEMIKRCNQFVYDVQMECEAKGLELVSVNRWIADFYEDDENVKVPDYFPKTKKKADEDVVPSEAK